MEKNNKEIKILIAEDEIPLLKAIGDKLERNGFKAIIARTVKQAVGLLEDVKDIDVIWLDHYLIGREDGLSFIAQLKNDDRWKNIPVFVVSNTAAEDKVQSYMQLGADKFYTKADSRLDQIIKDIKEHLEKKTKQ